uniref:Band 7 domain-containing protein n=1 Tax=Strigamia maritima TaxID=126957 RepID=T1IWT4_STRMM
MWSLVKSSTGFISLRQNNLKLINYKTIRKSALPLQMRWRSSTPMNTVVLFVPQQEAWVVERMGKYSSILQPGLNFLIPFIDKVKYVQSLKEIAIDIPQQSAITLDNVNLNIDGVLYLRILDPYRASYGVEDPEFAITQLAQTTMRSELGKIALDSVFRERESLNIAIVGSDADASGSRAEEESGRFGVRGDPGSGHQRGGRKKRSRILDSEALKTEEINKAQGEASAILTKAQARAEALQLIATSLSEHNGPNAASLNVAEQYVKAFEQLAKRSNTLILPSNTGDVSNMVAQAMSIYKSLHKPQEQYQVVGSDREGDEYFSDQDPEKPNTHFVKKDN